MRVKTCPVIRWPHNPFCDDIQAAHLIWMRLDIHRTTVGGWVREGRTDGQNLPTTNLTLTTIASIVMAYRDEFTV